MQWILHCLDYKQCLELLKNCYEALPVNGKVIVVDLVIPESPDTNLLFKSLFQFELFMMTQMEAERKGQKKNSRAWQKEQAFLAFE